MTGAQPTQEVSELRETITELKETNEVCINWEEEGPPCCAAFAACRRVRKVRACLLLQLWQLVTHPVAAPAVDCVLPYVCGCFQILETKVRKLEQLVRLKDAKIQTLMAKLQAAGMA